MVQHLGRAQQMTGTLVLDATEVARVLGSVLDAGTAPRLLGLDIPAGDVPTPADVVAVRRAIIQFRPVSS